MSHFKCFFCEKFKEAEKKHWQMGWFILSQILGNIVLMKKSYTFWSATACKVLHSYSAGKHVSDVDSIMKEFLSCAIAWCSTDSVKCS
jgi:hypothetical protein